MTPLEQALLNALLEWRQALFEAGVPEPGLPLERDLDVIAVTPGVTREVLQSLPLQRPGTVEKYAIGILATLRTTRANFVEPPPAPEPVAPAPAPAQPEPPRAQPPPPPVEPHEPDQVPEPPAVADDQVAREEARRRRQRQRDATAGPADEPGELPLDHGEFAQYDLARAVPGVPGRLATSVRDDGVHLRWELAIERAAVVLYRVVSKDDVDVWSPDEADAVAVTLEEVALDRRPFSSAARYYAVWSYSGTDVVSARSAQPTLLARGRVIAPPTQLRLTEDHGVVMASWDAPRGTHRVDLLRLPVDQAARPGYLQQYKLTEATGRSVQDRTSQPGQEYEYRLFAVLVDPVSGQEQWSDPVTQRLRVSAVLTPVQDLQAIGRQHDDRTFVDLSWQQPKLNEVRIYRTTTQPAAGAGLEDLDVSGLPLAGLPEDSRMLAELQVADGRGAMSGVLWPDEWSRVHFTPVSVSGSTARIGRTATLSRTSAIRDVRLVQRVMWQLLTFSWPEDAVSVSVYRTPLGTGMEESPGEPQDVLTREEYRRRGGLLMKLPLEGCALHLVPVSYYDRQRVPGRPTTTTYRGLYRMTYRIVRPEVAPVGRRGRGAPVDVASDRLRVEVAGELSRPPDVTVQLTVVHHRTRLALSVRDEARVLLERRLPLPGGLPDDVWTPLGELDLDLPAGGFLRVFARAEEIDIALLDPELETLVT